MYKYTELKKDLFTENGQEIFMSIRDNVKDLLKQAGAFQLQEAIRDQSGDSWLMLACFDRMVETGELREITGDDVMGQHRVFVATHSEKPL